MLLLGLGSEHVSECVGSMGVWALLPTSSGFYYEVPGRIEVSPRREALPPNPEGITPGHLVLS